MPTIIISSTFISEPVKPILSFWLTKSNLTMDVKFTPYNQVIQQLINPQSMLRQNENGINVLSIRFEDWHDHTENSSCNTLKKNLDLFIEAISSASKQSKSTFIIAVSPSSPKFNNEFHRLEQWLQSSLQDQANIVFLTGGDLLSRYPMSNPHNEFSNALGHIPYVNDFYAALGTMLARKIFALKHSPYKVIVLDCDNTLWKGVCGEVGAIGVEISSAFKELQQFMLQQRTQGMLLCLCSKNNEEDVFAVFSQHPDMILRKEHISAFRINWNRKSQNIRALAKELGLGLDSFIFIDDSPMECAEVSAGTPEVLVLQLPEAQLEIQNFLQHNWLFDHIKVTDEDKNRATTYHENAARERFKENTGGMADFIAGLDLNVAISELSHADVARASQLTQRTNQFNLTTIRRSEADIFNIIKNNFECRTIKVKDRFGDYGLVGLLFFEIVKNKMYVDTFLLSCRVLGRGVEHVIIEKLGEEALTRNIAAIEFKYAATKRNEPALKFLQSIAESQSENTYQLSAGQASKVKIDPNVNYSEAISENTAESKTEQQTAHFQSDSDLSLIQDTTTFITVDAIKQAVFQYYLKSRDATNISNEYISPKSDKEKTLTKIWERALKISPIGTQDNFFHLGGNSLIAVQIISDIYALLNVTLNLTDLFNHPNINELLVKINNVTSTNEMIIPDEVKQEPIGPLSFAQQRIWFSNQLIENKTIYNVPVVLRLNGDLQIDILQKSLDILLERHAILRTRINTNHGEPLQEILPISEGKLTLQYQDISNKTQQLDGYIKNELGVKFTLSEYPLMKATLFKTKNNEYTFCLVSHHIITDAQSLDILFNELVETYNAIKFNIPINQVTNKQEYQDFIRWQNSQFQNNNWEKQLAHWKSQLTDATYPELPNDKMRQEKRSYDGSRSSIPLTNELFQKLKTIAKAEQVTLFMVLLGILQTVLYRQSGQEDIIIGVPITNRNHLDVNTLGLFVNTLAMRFSINKDLTFSELLKKVRKVALDSYDNQDAPFEKVLETLKIKRNRDQNPLFSVMCSHRQKRSLQAEFDGLTSEFLDYSSPTSLFDLTLIMEESENDLKLCFEYATDRFSENTIKKLSVYFQNLIIEITNHPNKKLRDIIRCDQAQEMKIISEWNNTKQVFPENKTLQQCFEERVLINPDAIALVCQDKELSYQELNTAANQLAHILRNEYHIRPGNFVAIGMESGINYILSILAILKSGGAYLPLDPDYPLERLQWMITDAQPTVLLSSQLCSAIFSQLTDKLINLDDKSWQEKIANADANTPDNLNHATDLAYVIYTSGSTGKPKGVMLEHRSVNNLVLTQKNKFLSTPPNRILQFSSMCFDVSVWEWTMALFSGSTLYILPQKIKRDPKKLISACRQYQITHLTLPPGMLAVLPEADLPYIKVLMVAGEACPENVFKKWQHKAPMLINGYGPTETTVFSSFHKYEGKSSVVIGRPIANTQYYILDEDQEPVPIGMSGELYIGGIGLARGYLNRDDLTKERFVNTPMGRLYKTGDSARFDTDGLVTFLGRTDHQVKIRGYRVELTEIENQITQNKDVQQAIVILNDNTQLVAYVALQNELNLSEDDKKSILKTIRSDLKKKLPSYMLPGGFVILNFESFPLLPNGKIDRQKLTQQKHPFYQTTNSYVATSDSVEFSLAETWKETLNIERISIDDDFFLIGGNSLLAASLVVKIEDKFNQAISLDEFYSAPTIGNIAILLKKKLQGSLNFRADDILFSKCLLPIQTKGDLLPLFIIHPSLGLALPYIGLAPYFSDQPIYGLSNPYFGNAKKHFTSIKEMANFYNSVIQKVQRRGSFVLAGWSFGGIVALEMARQLKQQNKQVNNVILLDSYHPKCLLDQSENVVNTLLLQYKINPASEEAALIKFEIKQNTQLAKSFYRYEGNVNIIKARETLPEHKLNGWENSIFPNPRVNTISCSHESLFDTKHIEQTAFQMRGILKPDLHNIQDAKESTNNFFSKPIPRNEAVEIELVRLLSRSMK